MGLFPPFRNSRRTRPVSWPTGLPFHVTESASSSQESLLASNGCHSVRNQSRCLLGRSSLRRRIVNVTERTPTLTPIRARSGPYVTNHPSSSASTGALLHDRHVGAEFCCKANQRSTRPDITAAYTA